MLKAALEVFDESGVDAPVREIAQRAGVRVGTLYRHFPQRSDLIVAIVQKEVDACAGAAIALAKKHAPVEALARWMQRLVDLIATKRGLAMALHSGVGVPGASRLFPEPLDARVADAARRRSRRESNSQRCRCRRSADG